VQNDVIVKTFNTYKHKYAYDRHTNAIIVLTEDEHDELHRVEMGELSPDQSQVIVHYNGYGMFLPNVIEKIEHADTEIIEHYLTTRIQHLTLQVTQQCNLRCEYCTYSGIYSGHRMHSNLNMSFETAKKAIDFLLERSNELAEVILAFYGGEPLLDFDLIKRCVEYAKSQIEGKSLRFMMTTNGTLLTDSVVDFLVDNDFSLVISMDGSKEEHDRSRKFPNGGGTFDIIIKNIKAIRDRYPEYDRKISIATTINPHMDLSCVLEYFTTDEVFSDKNIMFNDMIDRDYQGELSYDRDYYRIRNFEYIKMLFSLIGKLDRKYVSPLVSRAEGLIEQKRKSIANHTELFPKLHHGGPCHPGTHRPFVRVDGAILPCERVNEAFDYFVIGNLDDGYDIEKIKPILNIGKLTENKCKSCWGIRQCMLCAAQMEFDSYPSAEDKLKLCPNCLYYAITDLHELCVLNEFGYDVEGITVQ